MSLQTFQTTNNKTVTLTADPEDDTARLDDVSLSHDQISCSINAKANNTGNVYVRKYGSSGDWIPVAAGEGFVLVVSNLNQIEAYSDNGTEVLSTFISLA